MNQIPNPIQDRNDNIWFLSYTNVKSKIHRIYVICLLPPHFCLYFSSHLYPKINFQSHKRNVQTRNGTRGGWEFHLPLELAWPQLYTARNGPRAVQHNSFQKAHPIIAPVKGNQRELVVLSKAVRTAASSPSLMSSLILKGFK